MKRWIVVALGLGVLAIACGDEVDRVSVTGADSGEEIEVAVDDRFEVRLESNPSTGYGWVIASQPDAIETVSNDFDEPDGELVGAAGTEIHVFRAAEPGAGVLRFEYVRRFDDPVVPERIVEFIVRVGGADWPPDNPGVRNVSTATADEVCSPGTTSPVVRTRRTRRERVACRILPAR